MVEKETKNFLGADKGDTIFDMENPLKTIEACFNRFDFRRINGSDKEAYMLTPENSMYRRSSINNVLMFVEAYLLQFGETSDIYKRFEEAAIAIRGLITEDATFPTPYEAVEKTRQLLLDLREELIEKSS